MPALSPVPTHSFLSRAREQAVEYPNSVVSPVPTQSFLSRARKQAVKHANLLKAQGPPDVAPNTGGTRPFSRVPAAITCASYLVAL
jgi:hypothetical protein